MQTETLPYLMLYEHTSRQLPAPTPRTALAAHAHVHFIIPVPVGWSSSSLHVQGPINRIG